MLWRALLVVGAALAIALLIAHAAPGWQAAPAVAAAVTFLGGALVGLGPVVALAPMPLTWRGRGLVSAAAVTTVGAVAWLSPSPVSAMAAVNLALVSVAVAVGGGIGRGVQHPGHLLAACLVGAAADIVSVVHPSGPTHAIASSERALSLFAVSFPVPSTTAIAPVLGVGDLLFAALIVGAAARHGLSRLRVAALILGGVLAAGLASALLEAPVPALVTIGLAVIIGEPRARGVAPRDRKTTQLAAVIAASCVLAVLAQRWLSLG